MNIDIQTPALEGGKATREKFIPFGSPIVEEEAIASVVETLRSGWIGTGPKVKEFEKQMSAHLGIKHSHAMNSCTAALHIALLALGIGAGDEVIVPDLTFCATINCVLYAGAKPVIVDIDPKTYNICTDAIEKAISPKTKAIIAVDLAGFPINIKAIKAIADKHKLFFVEDTAHAVESKYEGVITGSKADIACYSFYVNKNLTTAEGGLLAHSNDNLTEIIQQTALHGLSADAWKRFSSSGFKPYEVVTLGYKYNMTDIQAALGIAHLAKINEYWERRNQVWQRYNEGLSGLALKLPPDLQDASYTNSSYKHARHLYIINLELESLKCDRDQILQAMQAEGIGCGIHYKALHEHKYYRETLDINYDSLPHSSKLSSRILSLPIFPKLSDTDIDDVIAATRKVFKYYQK